MHYKYITIFFTLMILGDAFGSTSFSVAPAPIPHPNYSEDKLELKHSATFVNIKDEKNFDVSGYGYNINGRQVLKNQKMALDGLINFVYLEGSAVQANGELTGFTLNIQLDLEYQLYKKDKLSLIGYGGFLTTMNFTDIGIPATAITSTAVMMGLPFGIQLGYLAHRDWTIAPYIKFDYYVFGSSVTKTEVFGLGGSSTSSSNSIDPFLNTGFGLDIIYEPYDISLATALQTAGATGNNNETNVTIVQLSWSHTF